MPGGGGGDLDAKIKAQGDLVRKIKGEGADKAAVGEAVKALLALKAEFKAATGADWKPDAAPAKAPAAKATPPPKAEAPKLTGKAAEIDAKIK